MYIDQKKLLQKDAFSSIIGLKEQKDQIRSALIAGRHIILIGAPGIGKTTLAKDVAKLLDPKQVKDPFTGKLSEKPILGEDRFIRVQGSPDLTAEDLIGDIDPLKAITYGPLSMEAFTPGKIFKAHQGVLFFDEINRCGEKLQNALLQVLEERTVTIGSYVVDIPADFIFIGTMNPDDTSTEPLSEVFLDRFDIIYASYPDTAQDEEAIVVKRSAEVAACSEKLRGFMIQFIRELRQHEDVQRKPSVRASIGLYERSQANAVIDERKEVLFKDIQKAVVSVLSHRITLKPSVKFLRSPESFIQEVFEKFSAQHAISDEEGDVP